jgi:hypothetical protein
MREIETLTIPREAYFNLLFVLPLRPLKFTASSHPQSFPCRPLTSGQHRSSPLTSRLIRKFDMFLNIRQRYSRSIDLNTLFEIPNAQ